jgi:hypothetical protein
MHRRDRRLSAHEITALRALCTFGSALSGVLAGLSAAGIGLALSGRPLLELEPARMQLFLVVGPLLGLWPPASLSFVAAHSALMRGWAPWLLGLWLGCAATATVWFGLVSLLR